jgi:hypothetical protein
MTDDVITRSLYARDRARRWAKRWELETEEPAAPLELTGQETGWNRCRASNQFDCLAGSYQRREVVSAAGGCCLDLVERVS